MYRKIIFVIFLIVQIDVIIKVLILLSLSFISLTVVIIYKPFILQELNILELKSNFAALTVLFVGNLYLCDIYDSLKAICFVVIVIINTWFFLNFLFDLIFLFFQIHFEKINKILPRFTVVFAKILIEIEGLSIRKCLKWKSFQSLPKQFKSNDFKTKEVNEKKFAKNCFKNFKNFLSIS